MTTATERARELFKECDPFGPLHIIVEDGNIEDRHLDWCAKKSELNEQERELIAVLRQMSIEDRFSAWEDGL